MAWEWKTLIQGLANRLGYRIQRLDPAVSLIDPYAEQSRLVGPAAATVFEVGAADGQHAVRYAELFPKAIVYAFEPVPESFAKLAAAADGRSSVRPFQLALSDAAGTARMHLSKWIEASSLLPPKATGASFDAYQASRRSIDVATDTLDAICAREHVSRIDLLKMDAQGAELRILAGAAAMLRAGAIGVIYSEVQFIESYEGAGQFDEMMLLLKGHGFRLHNLYDLHHNHRGELCWGDAIFVHDGARR